MPLARNAFRALAGVLLVGALVHVGSVVPRVAEMARDLPREATYIVAAYSASALVALAACALAAVLLWQAAHRPAGRVLTLFLAFLAIFWGSLFRFLQIESTPDSVSIDLSYGGGWVSRSASASFLLAVAAFLRFSALFPRPLTAERLGAARRLTWLRRMRVALLNPLVVWSATAVAIVILQYAPRVTARALGLSDASSPADIRVFSIVNFGVLITTYLVAPLAAFVLGVRNLRASYRSVTEEERKRTLWVVSGFSVATWMILAALAVAVIAGPVGFGGDLLSALIPLLLLGAPLVAVAGAAVGVLYGGAIDSALALRKSTVLGALGAVAVVAFAGLENVLSEVIEGRLGMPGVVGPLVSGAIVAAVLVPVRKVVLRKWTAPAPAPVGHQPANEARPSA